MILSRLSVPSFAGLANTEVDFSAGLNVIVGPNEAGKSTLFQALVHTLLTPARLPKPRFQSTIEPYLPVGGGDTIGAELVFEQGDQTYRLRKRWGATPEAELELPNGSRLTEEESIQETLGSLLPVDPGTLQAVFLTYQAGLVSTLDEIAEHPEALHSLSDLLRRSILESDKVSIGGFRDLLEDRIRGSLGHWDVERGRPAGGRGWNNPWKKDKGSVLAAFYELQELEARQQQTLEAETAYEERLHLLEDCRRRLDELQTALREEAPIALDAQRRSALQYRIDAEAVRRETLEKSYTEWTESLLVREGADQERARLLQESQRLEKELEEAKSYARLRTLSESFTRARERMERWEAARSALEEAVALPRQTMEALRSAAAELQRLEGALAGGALSMHVEARKDLNLSATRDLEEPQDRRLEPGEDWEVQARGRIRLEHRDWTLEVTSGDGGFQDILRRHGEAGTRLQSLLRDSGISSLQEAEEAHRRYERLVLEAEAARKAFDEALEGESWESLQAAAQSLPENPPPQDSGEIVDELVSVKARQGGIDDSFRRASERISALEKNHENREALLRRMGDQSALVQGLERELAGLRELPEGVEDADAFLERHRQTELEAQALREQRAGLESALDEALLHLPVETAEEIGSRVEEARSRFERELSKAQALLRVREIADSLLESLDDNGTEALRSLFGEYIQRLSKARYRAAGPTSLLPEALERDDGTVLRYELLSVGTRDLFALALRLSMAELYLTEGGTGKNEGFLVMDDPLVDMDPERQRLAAAVLARFAERQQLIVFTCHPTHAELLEAAFPPGRAKVGRIELSRS